MSSQGGLKSTFRKLLRQSKKTNTIPSGPADKTSGNKTAAKSSSIQRHNDIDVVAGKSTADRSSDPAVDESPHAQRADDWWDQAYHALEKSSERIVRQYEDLLKVEGLESGSRNNREQQLRDLVQKKIDAVKDARWSFRLGGRDVEVREVYNKIVETVIYAKDFVGAVVRSDPHAAIAWAGVTLLLPLLLNPSQKDKAALKALAYVSGLILDYRLIEINVRNTTALKSEGAFATAAVTLATELSDKIISLYTKILILQMRAVCHYSSRTMARDLENIFNVNNWESWSHDIKESDVEIRRSLPQLCPSGEVLDQIKAQKSEVHQLLSLVQLQGQMEEERKFLSWHQTFVRQIDVKVIKGRIPERHPETCSWFLGSPQFEAWRDSKQSELLLLVGDPGCGKSVLLRALVDENFLKQDGQNRIICYFPFSQTSAEESSVTEAMCAILDQLFVRAPELLPRVVEACQRKQEHISTRFSDLWAFLLEAANIHSGEIVCLFDGLDKCDEYTGNAHGLDPFLGTASVRRADFISEIMRWYGSGEHSKYGRLKLLFSCSPFTSPKREYEALVKVVNQCKLDGQSLEHRNAILKDILAVTRTKIERLGIPENSKADLYKILREKQETSPSYEWLMLIMVELQDYAYSSATINGLKAFVKSVKALSVDAAYEAMLDRSKHKPAAKLLLALIVGARRPLSLVEMKTALEISDRQLYAKYEIQRRTLQEFEDLIKDWCHTIVIIIDGEVQLIHPSAREFLLKRSLASSPLPKVTVVWGGIEVTLTPRTHDELLSIVCIDYLTREDLMSQATRKFSVLAQECSKPPVRSLSAAVKDIFETSTIINYAAENWQFHVLSLRRPLDPTIPKREQQKWDILPDVGYRGQELLCVDSLAFRTWFICFWQHSFNDVPIRRAFYVWIYATSEALEVHADVQKLLPQEWKFSYTGVASSADYMSWMGPEGGSPALEELFERCESFEKAWNDAQVAHPTEPSGSTEGFSDV